MPFSGTATPPAHPYHHGDLRNALLKAARTMLEERPLSEMSLRAVARAAGVSHAAPYRHFPCQEALMAEVACDGFRELSGTLAAIECSDNVQDRLRALGRAYMTFVANHPSLTRLMFSEQISDRYQYADLRAAADAVAAKIGNILHDAETGSAVWMALHGIAMMALERVTNLTPQPDDVDGLCDFAARALSHLLRLPPA